MDKFLLSTPGLVITGVGCLAILWLVGKLLGASFFFIAAVVIVFLIVVLLGMGFVMFDSWLLSEQPTHVIRVLPPAKSK